MNQEFKQCIEKGKIVSFSQGTELVKKEIEVARNDLLDAKIGYGNQRYKWSTIQAYYAMFHAARALIYSRGYREKSHYCLAVALRELFVDKGQLEIKFVRDLLNAMNMRESADYDATFSLESAKTIIASAEQFIEKATLVLELKEQ